MKNQTVKKINKAISLNNFKYVLFVVLTAIQSVLSVYFALSVKNLVNTVEYGKGGNAIVTSAIILVAVVLASYILGVIVNLLSDNLQTGAELSLKDKTFKNFLNGSYKNVSKISSGDLVSRLEGDVNTVASVKINLIPGVISTAVRLVGTIVALFVLQPTFTLVILAIAVIIVICSFVIRKFIYKLHKNSRTQSSKQSSVLVEASSNALAVKAFNAEAHVHGSVYKNFLNYKNAKLKERYFGSFVSSAINLCFTAFYASAVIFGVYGIYTGSNGVDFGVIIAILQLVLQIKAPVSNVSSFFTAYAEMLVCGERLFGLESEKEIRESLTNFDKIEVKDLDFSYDSELVLKGLSFTINKGDRVLLNGGSGEGKTTLIKLLMGLYPASAGNILVVSGEKEYAPTSISGLCSFVPQGNMIFSKSIKENVVFASEYNEEKFINAIKVSGLVDFINTLPEKENTVLGSGVSLSEGQEQRLAIARAIYHASPIMVLDEPTSALDVATETAVVGELLKDKQKTFIIISHKPSFDGLVNKTITISQGKSI